MPPDQQWGRVQEDGTMTGITREVATRRVHFAIDEFTITGKEADKSVGVKIWVCILTTYSSK